jgi:autophagy-related protein 33
VLQRRGGNDAVVEINGEQVERTTRDRQVWEFLRTGVSGVGFAMAVVGIWGDGA